MHPTSGYRAQCLAGALGQAMTENDLVNSARHIKQTVGVGSDRSPFTLVFPSTSLRHILGSSSSGEWGIFWLHSARMLFLLRFLVSEGWLLSANNAEVSLSAKREMKPTWAYALALFSFRQWRCVPCATLALAGFLLPRRSQGASAAITGCW